MKKKLFSICKKIVVGVLFAAPAVVLFLNIFTALSVHAIKNGISIRSGYFCAIISSGSMEPAISKNDLLVLNAGGSYREGDIVTYVSHRGSLVTHRVTEAFSQSYLTQGDANNVPDDRVTEQRILGKVVFIVPGIGGLVEGILSPVGIIFFISIFILIWGIQRVGRDINEAG